MPEKAAACVVLYYPLQTIVDNIKSYASYVDCLIVVDNSENESDATEVLLRQHFERVIYKAQNKNIGIAAALNIACRIANSEGYSWLLTMDQDSVFLEDDFSIMIKDISAIKTLYHRVGIITPYHVLTEIVAKPSFENYEIRKIAMTSGNLLNLNAYKTTGIFDEKLFIDFVDYEYCLRLRRRGYTVVRNNKVSLKHRLGNFQIKSLFGRRLAVSHHNHQRKYYRIRNSLYVAFKYIKTEPRFFIHVMFENFMLIPFVILFYEENKLLKLKSVFRGIFDFTIGSYGKKFSGA